MLGVGIPLPVLNQDVIARCAVSDQDIVAPVIDFAIPRRVRPTFGLVNYGQLKKGKISIEGKTIKTAPLASISRSREVAQELKKWIESGSFTLTEPVASISQDRSFLPQNIWGSQISLD